MADGNRGAPWFVQLAFAVAAGFVVYGFVDMAKHAEMRRACDSLVQLRPRYLGAERSAPDFDLPDGEGGHIRLSDLRGKIVILHFWSVTCDICMQELPLVAKFAELVKNRSDVVILTVTIDENPDAVKRELTSKLQGDVLALLYPEAGKPPRPFKIAYDADNAIVRGKFGTKLFPETWLLDRAGTVRARFDGIPFAGESCDVAWQSPLLLSAIEALEAPAVCDITFDPKIDSRPEKLIAPCR